MADLSFVDDEELQRVNAAVERHAGHIVSLAFRLQDGVLMLETFDQALAEAKRIWLSLMTDPDVSRFASLPARETEAGRLLLQHLAGDRS